MVGNGVLRPVFRRADSFALKNYPRAVRCVSPSQDNPRGFNAELLRLCGVDVDPAVADAAYASTQDAVKEMAAAAAAEVEAAQV